MARTATITRQTSESTIELSLDLDGTGKTDIQTSVPFYNHMMTALGKHSLIDLTIRATGDTDIDAHHTVEDTADSILAIVGGFIAPVFAPMGFGVWQAAVALLTGLIAKEAVVSSMSLFYGFSLTDYAAAGAVMAATFSPAAALAFLVFCALYTPCVAAIATIRREMGSLSWTLLALIWQLGAAWLASFAVYQLAALAL